MEKLRDQQNPYNVELPQAVIESFARFLVPEIRKFYESEEGEQALKGYLKMQQED